MKLKQQHKISKINFSGRKLFLIIDGTQYEFLLSNISDKLSNASRAELEYCKISPSGYGLHWPLLDEDLSIDGLMRSKKSKHKLLYKEKI